ALHAESGVWRMDVTTPQIDSERLASKRAIAEAMSNAIWTAGASMVGDRLGLYTAMAGAGPLTSAELAERASVSERFVREWLYQQTAPGILESHPPDRFELTPEAYLVFGDVNNRASAVGVFARLPHLVNLFEAAVEAVRTGLGSPYQEINNPTG